MGKQETGNNACHWSALVGSVRVCSQSQVSAPPTPGTIGLFSKIVIVVLQRDGPSSLIMVDKERMERLEGEPWYKEVVELRKAANDYKV